MGGVKKAKRQPIVDCHQHVKWYGHDADRVVANLDRNGIDAAWLLTWEAPPEDTEGYEHVFWPGRHCMPLEDVVEAVAKYPDRFVPFYAPDPRDPKALRKLKGAVEHLGVRGVGEIKVRIMLDDPRALEMFYFCGERGLPVIIHMDVPLPRHDFSRPPTMWYCCDWENLARVLELFPKTIFIGHAPGFWREISGDADSCPDIYPKGPVKPGGRLPKYLDRYPNLYCDLSAGSGFTALSRDPEAGKAFLLKYQDRCLFGRDFYDDKHLDFIRKCRLPREAEARILGGNADRLVPRS